MQMHCQGKMDEPIYKRWLGIFFWYSDEKILDNELIDG